ncbi:LysR family transcriptional regulator [Globicatella sanguinis]|uniref:LysR family transcriptional regulator n=1 Tax=Globicatella sanguinis TaxID=13076 RepID=UPI00082674BF|nr:LysR family transcriptional regulator [Globicatella sanguinis]MDK7631584.1 LysR family transcriptional regulator [Globicatella sanguinis]WIK65513.1 LysR family transcriptional regulator [Globicatella sanguinis]WKT54918.1 LysR family transcriptional regulator [Globicatella sanguinis]
MNLRDLEYFKYLAESLSFTKTAEHFFVSQPSISIALKRLEDEFETTLIQRERSAKNIHLTPTGHTLYQRTIDMLGLYAQTKLEIKAVGIDTIQLGLVPSIGNLFLPQLLANANDYLQNLKLIEENTTDALFDSLRKQKFSIAIIAHDQPTFANLWVDTFPIAKSPLKLFVSQNHPLARYREISLMELVDLPYVSLSNGTIHEKLFQNWATTNQLSLDNVFYCHDMNTLTSLVASGERVALLMENVSLNRDDLVAIAIKNPPIGYLNLVINNEMVLSDTQKAFNDLLIKSIED